MSVINEKDLLDKFNFDNINYSKNIILNYYIKKLYNTNYFEIKEVDIDETILPNNIFSKFLSTRTLLDEETKNSYEHFKVISLISIQFEKKINTFFEIQFNGKNNNSILKMTIKSLNETDENINIDSTILNPQIENYNNNNINLKKYINTIEFSNISVKRNGITTNIFFIKLYYSNLSFEIIKVYSLSDGLENHFCENLLNVSVYSNPLNNNITIINNFKAEIYLDCLIPKIKSKRTKQFKEFATSYNSGHFNRAVSDDPTYAPLGDYLYDTKNYGGVGNKAANAAADFRHIFFGMKNIPDTSGIYKQLKKKKLYDALLINTENEYVIPAETVGYAWDDDYTNLSNRNKGTASGIRNVPLVLLNLHPVEKNGFTYYPLGDYAYMGKVSKELLTDLRKNKGKKEYNFKNTFNQTLPYYLIREDCLEEINNPQIKLFKTWSDASAPTPNSIDGSSWTYLFIPPTNKINSLEMENPGNYMVIYNGGKLSDNNFIAHYKKNRNFKIKKEFISPIPRPSITPENIKKIINNINDKLTIMFKNIQQPINTNISEYITKINKNQTDAQSSYTQNINFNKEMQDRQEDYKHNFLYVNEINTQLSKIRQKEKDFVNNQIKTQLTNNKNNVQKNITSQTNKFKNYDDTISKSSIDIGNQINEYVQLRKFRELLPDSQQVMF